MHHVNSSSNALASFKSAVSKPGNAEGSTLRLTLGCLLADQLGIRLTRVGSGTRYTFTNPGEIRLDTWLEQNALVCWVEDVRPWELEEQLLKRMSLPLNIDGNDHHPYNAKLRSCRTTARVAAKAGQCVADSGGPRTTRTIVFSALAESPSR